ncbi:MAG: LPP20 family lipoprotein [Sulfurimonadaceae bacterium]|jgi:hypothetical protein|nr:LPP20 family lipoprotein [Sulfurimonadaceae bacterium]
MYTKTLFTFIALIFLSACGASAAPVDAAQVWMQNPPSDTAKHFYAVGYGETQKDAKSDALATISAKISVDVASNFSSSVSATRQGSDESVLAETKSDVVSKSKNIEYTDVKVEESYNDGKQWVMLVAVDRDVLVATYERKLSQIDTKIKTEWDFYQKADFFEKIKISVNIDKYLKETDSFFPLLHALKSNYDDSKYTSRYQEYTREIRKGKKELVFKITYDQNSETLASLIKSKLSAENISFNNKNYNVHIDIKTNAKMQKYPSTNKEFANLTFALRNTVIKATDKNGNTVSNAVYKTKEGSSAGFEDAIARTGKYEQKINQIGIFPFITGN